MYDRLNLEKLLPLLLENNLLSDADISSTTPLSQKEKISNLIDSLSKKDSRALQKFLACLKSTSQDTGHGEIACQIEELACEFVPQPLKDGELLDNGQGR